MSAPLRKIVGIRQPLSRCRQETLVVLECGHSKFVKLPRVRPVACQRCELGAP